MGMGPGFGTPEVCGAKREDNLDFNILWYVFSRVKTFAKDLFILLILIDVSWSDLRQLCIFSGSGYPGFRPAAWG